MATIVRNRSAPDPEVWLLLAKGQRWKAQWTPDTLYSEEIQFIIQVVLILVQTNISIQLFTFPGDFAVDLYDYWDLNVPREDPVALTEKGDLLTYDYWRSHNYEDDSTLGDGRLGIANKIQILSVQSS